MSELLKKYHEENKDKDEYKIMMECKIKEWQDRIKASKKDIVNNQNSNRNVRYSIYDAEGKLRKIRSKFTAIAFGGTKLEHRLKSDIEVLEKGLAIDFQKISQHQG